ncbi:MAG: pyruvate formate lyase family protein, partial [Actinomycetota bacterium]
QRAEALGHVLWNKQAVIYPREILVGCFTSHRVGGTVFPELHGVPMMEDLFRFPRRKVNPFTVSRRERRQLLVEVLPFWLPRFLGIRVNPRGHRLAFIREELSPKLYIVNEVAGVAHFVPNYQGLVRRGTDGYRREVAQRLGEVPPGSPAAHFLHAVEIACDALDGFAERYRREAERQAAEEQDPKRREELVRIAEVCARVPRNPAESFHEALQSILFGQIAINIESLDNSVSPGRLDQILAPFYQKDLASGRLTPSGAFELLGCLALKLCEIVPVYSLRGTRFNGGMFNGQVVVVGGTDQEGEDATNEVSYLFLELMDKLRTRQPNYHARLHKGSPREYRDRIAAALADGAVSPALYNDEVIVPVLRSRGISEADARDLAMVGCVEPVSAGRSFLSTDAALFNLPMCLELALNHGRRFGTRKRIGAPTSPAEECGSIEDLVGLFRKQVEHALFWLIYDLKAVERANARLQPTPLASMLLEGCLENARDASSGGARYNGSGIQGIGVVEVGDSLAAVEAVVFRDRKASMAEIVEACRTGFAGRDALRARLLAAPKYGNDDGLVDGLVARAMEVFASTLQGRHNTRGGEYTAGFYSVTAHQAWGEVVGALPSGRLRGEPFSSGLSPGNGRDRHGPTAALTSYASLPLHFAKNGVNFNLQLPPWAVGKEKGARTLRQLIDGGFAAGCMQIQVNVHDPKMLVEARDHPGRYPGLLVRVSGYSAYFDDLCLEMKDEIIHRFTCESA